MAHADAAVFVAGSSPEAVLPDADAVRSELARIQASADFEVPECARKFLGYVVEETLAGRAERIKAYSIALEVFGRDASFDAQSDPVVRIEAGRVRRALERYYLTAGRADAVVITIPKGGYVPHFTARAAEADGGPADAAEATPTPAFDWRPLLRRRWFGAAALMSAAFVPVVWTFVDRPPAPPPIVESAGPDIPRLLIAPFEDLTGSGNSHVVTRGMTEEIVGHIARFKDLVVIDGQEPFGGAQKSARYILAGSVRTAGNAIRLTARLRSTADNSILWAQSYDANLQVQELLSIQAEIAREVATALAQPYGVIFQADAAQVTEVAPNDWQAYTCTLAYYTYRLGFSPETYAFVRDCLERTVAQYPGYSTAWALLSIVYVDGFRFRYKLRPSPAPPIEQALEYARRAIELDARNVRGQQALMLALFLNGEIPAALEVGRRALAVNPNDIELRGEYGVRLALSGRWEEGSALILDTLQRTSGPEGYYETNLALCAHMMRDNETAAMWIRKADVEANPLYHLIAAAIFGRLPSKAEAERERDWLLANARPLVESAEEEVALRLGRQEDRDYIIEGLRLAGLPVPPTP